MKIAKGTTKKWFIAKYFLVHSTWMCCFRVKCPISVEMLVLIVDAMHSRTKICVNLFDSILCRIATSKNWSVSWVEIKCRFFSHFCNLFIEPRKWVEICTQNFFAQFVRLNERRFSKTERKKSHVKICSTKTERKSKENARKMEESGRCMDRLWAIITFNVKKGNFKLRDNFLRSYESEQ